MIEDTGGVGELGDERTQGGDLSHIVAAPEPVEDGFGEATRLALDQGGADDLAAALTACVTAA